MTNDIIISSQLMTDLYQNIILIDDDPINNLINRRVLQRFREGLNITIFQEAVDALVFLKEGTDNIPDVIFLDINMPVMNGWDFLDEYKKLDISVPIIMLTSSIDREDMLKAKTYEQVKDYYIKPLDKENLSKLFN